MRARLVGGGWWCTCLRGLMRCRRWGRRRGARGMARGSPAVGEVAGVEDAAALRLVERGGDRVVSAGPLVLCLALAPHVRVVEPQCSADALGACEAGGDAGLDLGLGCVRVVHGGLLSGCGAVSGRCG